jgi:hypothetical protein
VDGGPGGPGARTAQGDGREGYFSDLNREKDLSRAS